MVRLKHRYLLLNILYPESPKSSALPNTGGKDDIAYSISFHRPSDDRVDAKFLTRLVREAVADLFGDYGSGMIAGSLQVKYCSSATNTAIVRVSRDHYRLVWAALTCINMLPKPVNQPCTIHVVRVSGTIKKAEEEAIRCARLSIQRAQKSSRKPTMLEAGTIAPAPTPGNGRRETLDSPNRISDQG